ncbi:hypothetical protein M885DRAFT_426354, partial [Pelagophyceae sp. CCMP2097]
ERWTAGDAGVAVEEHYVSAQPQIFGAEAYAYWRYGLNGPRAPARPGVDVESFAYSNVDALLAALTEGRLKKGAMVFVDVRYHAVDSEWIAPAGAKLAAARGAGASLALDRRKQDSTCVYDYTPDLFLRSRLLRGVWAYEKPLTVVLTGDVACRLRQLPQTHHRVVLADDAAGAQCESLNALWWPQGLEGLSNFAMDAETEADAFTLTDFVPLRALDKPFLFSDVLSVNGRKPSREALVRALEAGVGEGLERLAQRAGKAATLDAQLTAFSPFAGGSYHLEHWADGEPRIAVEERVALLANASFGGNAWRATVASAAFALCPAGDVWSSGRILTAMLLGTIPVVDATYHKDPASKKGCGDPARFWRSGSADFPHAAPFVFVERWDDLPAQLDLAGAADPSALQRRLDDVAAYRARLEAHLRGIVLGAPAARPPVECATTPLSDDERKRYNDGVRAYYADPDWFDGNNDLGSVPGATCTSRFHTKAFGEDIGAPCFDAACAPPRVAAFRC